MPDPNTIMADLLLELERELRMLELWSEQQPTAEMLASSTPFAADRLNIEQWLQWIFIPTIKQMIETGAVLPTTCNIHPYAEECMKPREQTSDSLLSLLLRIDRHLSGTDLD